MRKAVPLAEALVVFALIMLYIWRLRWSHGWLWLLPLAIVIGSQAARREGPGRLGLAPRTAGLAFRRILPASLVLAAALLVGGAAAGTLSVPGLPRLVFNLVAYIGWGLFQQYVLNSYFLNRLAAVTGDAEDGLTPLAAATLFALVHLPNWFLMAVTLAGGYACARLYLRYRNLYALGVAHGVIATALLMAVPESVTGHFLVGPRYIWRLYGP